MSFVREDFETSPYVDKVFEIRKKAESDNNPDSINATIGSLKDENSKLYVFSSVYRIYDSLPDEVKAAYSSAIKGNPDFLQTVINWVDNGLLNLEKDAIATPGGTGAIDLAINCCLKPGDNILIPEIGWGSYSLMAKENHLNAYTYPLFDGDKFAIEELKKLCKELISKNNKLFFIINDPCQNPTGYSLTHQEWQELIDFFNELSKEGEIIILDDIAYIDFAKEDSRSYFKLFNQLNEKILFLVAFSASKTLSAYGMRLGALLSYNKNKENIDDFTNACVRFARCTWSNSNNGFMHCFNKLFTEHQEEYLKERAEAVSLIAERAEIFLKEAKEVDLPIYPYKDGYFVTVKIEKDKINAYQEALIRNSIYAVPVNKGIRIALCSLNKEKTKGLAKKLKEVLDEIA